jgi:hypothetical protein
VLGLDHHEHAARLEDVGQRVGDLAGHPLLHLRAPGVDHSIGSRARHIEAGAWEVLLPGLDGIRQDVDTVEDLELARALGLGPHTRAVVSAVMEGVSPAHPRTPVRIRWSSVVRFGF